MADGPRISHTSAMILQAIGIGHIYGYTVMEVTGLASGTVYPALRRLERELPCYTSSFRIMRPQRSWVTTLRSLNRDTSAVGRET